MRKPGEEKTKEKKDDATLDIPDVPLPDFYKDLIKQYDPEQFPGTTRKIIYNRLHCKVWKGEYNKLKDAGTPEIKAKMGAKAIAKSVKREFDKTYS